MARSRAALPTAFWRLWVSALTSDLGDGLVLVALPLLALTLTHNPLLIAGVAVADHLPAFVLSPFIGVVIDRIDRRTVVIAVQALQCLIAGGLAIGVARGEVTLPLLYAGAATLGACSVAFSVATTVLVPSFVDDADLEWANGRLYVAEASSRDLVGQGAGGAVFALGRAVPFLADAVSFFVSAAVLWGCLPRGSGPETPPGPWRADLADGWRFFVRSAALRRLAVLVCSFAGCQAAAFATMSLYLTGEVHAGRVEFGLLLTLGSAGSLVGTTLAARLVDRHGSWMATAMGGAAAGWAYLLLSVHASAPVAGAALAVEGAAVVVGNVASSSLRQRMIPDDLRGRVGTAFRMALLGSGVVGAAAGGVLSGVLGTRGEMAVVAAVQLTVVAVVAQRGHIEAPAASSPGGGGADGAQEAAADTTGLVGSADAAAPRNGAPNANTPPSLAVSQ